MKGELEMSETYTDYVLKLDSQKLNGQNRYFSCDMIKGLGLFEAMKVRDFVEDLIAKRCSRETHRMIEERIETIERKLDL